VLAEIKCDPGLATIPAIVLTTSESESDVLQAYGLHANCYIHKPVDFEKFAQVIREMERFWFALVTLPPKT
jgi:chemotaxis family two-component system response regulator Rcp1